MKIKDVLREIEQYAPLSLQEGFDNAGLQVGDVNQPVSGVLISLDITEAVVDEAISLGCNLLISHHPLLFRGLKSVTGATYIERCVVKACKHDLVIYAAHTNLDNAFGGVNFHLAEMIGLKDVHVLQPQSASDLVYASQIGGEVGSGTIGELPESEDASHFLLRIKELFHVDVLRHSALRPGQKIKKVALCGGSGAFLIKDAISRGADVFITGEAKYNDFYDVEDQILLAVIGHFESEICTKDIFYKIISKKIPTFAVHFSNVNSNPVNYL